MWCLLNRLCNYFKYLWDYVNYDADTFLGTYLVIVHPSGKSEIHRIYSSLPPYTETKSVQKKYTPSYSTVQTKSHMLRNQSEINSKEKKWWNKWKTDCDVWPVVGAHPLAGRHLRFLLLLSSLLLFFHRFPACGRSRNQEVIRSQGENWRLSFSLGQHSATAALRFFSRIGLFGWLWLVFSYFSLVCCFYLGWRSPVVLFSRFCSLLGLRFFYCFSQG